MMLTTETEMDGTNNYFLTPFFDAQKRFQQKVTGKEILPVDDLQWYSYHVQAMVEEFGELMKSDKRWKTHRNIHYDISNKKEELSDIFITFINLCIFSGIDASEISLAIMEKLKNNIKKLEKENKK